MITSIYFNNFNSYKDLGLTIADMSNIPIANEEVEINNGYTIRMGKYPTLELPITFRIKHLHGLHYRQDKIMSWLTDIKDNRLMFSFAPRKYYIVKNVIVDNLIRDIYAYNSISVTFILEPFKYEMYERVMTLTKSEKVQYKGTAPGEPNFKIYGNGNIQLTINSETVQINNVNGYVELDSKYLLCLNEDKTSKSRDMIGGFPMLTKGINDISWTGNVTKVELQKRTAYL